MKYVLEMETDLDFDFRYKGKKTKYGDSLRILLVDPDKKTIIDVLNDIKIIPLKGKEKASDWAEQKRKEMIKLVKRGKWRKEKISTMNNFGFILAPLEEDEWDAIVIGDDKGK